MIKILFINKLSFVGNKHLSLIFLIVMIFLLGFSFDSKASEDPVTTISTFNKSTHLTNWQIAKDTDPRLSLPTLPDSLWQLFEPTSR